jgi:hypothetical protein
MNSVLNWKKNYKLDWERMAEGVQSIQAVFAEFETSIATFLGTLL